MLRTLWNDFSELAPALAAALLAAVERGKLVQDRTNFGVMGMMQQLGMVPEPQQTGS